MRDSQRAELAGHLPPIARRAGAHVIGTPTGADVDRVRELGADEAIDVGAVRLEAAVAGEMVDVVVDLVGHGVQARSLDVLKPGGWVLVSAVPKPDRDRAARRGIRASFMLVDVSDAALAKVARLLDEGRLRAGNVGEVLPLDQAVRARRTLEGAAPRKRGEIVLAVSPRGRKTMPVQDAVRRVPDERPPRGPARLNAASNRAGKGGGIHGGASSRHLWKAPHA
jgi:D-arabinose 1-dehydrogenase-like Zn-dependent alcohol dehydrogenase